MNKQNGISLWELNALNYSAAVTLLERQGKLKEKQLLGNHRINLDGKFGSRKEYMQLDKNYLISMLS